MKFNNKGEYEPYREIPMELLDPHNKIPPINTMTKNTIPKEDDTPGDEEPDWTKLMERKRKRVFKKKLKI